MSYSSAWGPSSPPGGLGGEWAARPRYTVTDVVTLLWRDRMVMLGVFAALLVIGLAAALVIKTQYPAHSSILVRLGQEYVYEPSVGDAARGAIPSSDQLIQSEVEILSSAELRRRVIQDLGLARVMPARAAAFAAAAKAKQAQLMDQAVDAMGTSLKVDSAPDASIVRVTYSDTDPDRAALVLGKLLDEYLVYRRNVLLDGSEPYIDQQLQAFQARLAQTDAAYQGFLAQAGVADFDTEKSSLNSVETSLTSDAYLVQARLKEIEGRLGEMARQVGKVAPEISLYHDTSSAPSDKLIQLQLERQDLLSRYKPSSQPVRDVEQKIAQLQAMLGSGAQAPGARRFGANPVYQTLQTEQIQLTAEAESMRQRQAALADELAQVAERRQKLNALEPQYLALSRDRQLLQDEIKGLIQKKQESQAAQSIASKSSDNIRIIERPTPPTAGKSLKKPIAVLAFLFAGFTALCVGLLRLFLRRGFPTAASASRTLELPVLATAALKPH
jgi:uncharacterized protein involved in exopolysaccharide biosynthesis